MAKKVIPKTYEGKSTKLGGGGKFAMMKDALMNKGMSADLAAAVTASAGRAKYGAAKMNKMAQAGKNRAKK